jgi:hypothetical protein
MACRKRKKEYINNQTLSSSAQELLSSQHQATLAEERDRLPKVTYQAFLHIPNTTPCNKSPSSASLLAETARRPQLLAQSL